MSSDRRDSLQEFLGVLSRRKFVVLLSVVLTTLGAFIASSLQTPLYEASAIVATTGGTASVLGGNAGNASAIPPERIAATNVNLARLPKVAERVIAAAHLTETPPEFLARSTVTAQSDADILSFNVRDRVGANAATLATLYAKEFTDYRNALAVDGIRSTRTTIAKKLASLAAEGERGSALYAELANAARELDAAEAVQGSATVLVQPAATSFQIQPRTVRSVGLGLALGLILGIALAFLAERLDTRIRTAEQVEQAVGLTILGELPRPPDIGESRARVTMLDFPHGPYAESVRKLRSNLEFANLGVGARSIMITSAVEGEGKTTTAADLAVALARSGKKVAICDMDARAPNVNRIFGLEGRRGLVEVAFGLDSLAQALVPVSFGPRPARASTVTALPTSERHEAGPAEVIHVLPFGSRRPPNPGDFVGSTTVREIVADLTATHDIVIIDTSPMLPVSDALAISEYVDAALFVCRLETTRKPTLMSLRRAISAFPTHALGLVVTGVPAIPGYGPYHEHGVSQAAPSEESRARAV
jgi:Mrp family chromosome partitioning ATPase/capsular polysaccharide biosynthesis protein